MQLLSIPFCGYPRGEQHIIVKALANHFELAFNCILSGYACSCFYQKERLHFFIGQTTSMSHVKPGAHSYFSEAGKIPRLVEFIVDGVMRGCYYNNRGEEITRHFISAKPGCFTRCYYPLPGVFGKPSFTNQSRATGIHCILLGRYSTIPKQNKEFYLGITAEMFSRIRKQTSKSN